MNPFVTSSDFLLNYLAVVQNDDTAIIATWLFDNAKNMDKTMFFSSRVNWNAMKAVDVLTLRAFAPNNVFDSSAETGYLTRVGDNSELAKLSSYIFKDDYQFITGLPEDLKNQMIQLVQMVYRAGIRKEDKRVKSM